MSKGRVLIVDDSKLQRDKMTDILRGGGYEVLVADDGLVGFQMAIKEKPHIVISDIQMPTLDGISFCKALKEHGSTRSIPVVFLSTLDSMDDLVKGLEAGANDYLSKQTDGAEQVLAMAAVHVAYSKKVREKRRDEDTEEATGEEFQSVTELPATFFDGMSFGLVIANLRRQPIYMNPAARWALGYDDSTPLSSLAGPDFEDFLSLVARGYQAPSAGFFFPVDRVGKQLGCHLEQVYSARREICGVMVFIQTT
jgi:CheY-like chemotaxis protein